MAYTRSEVAERLKALLPSRWFGTNTPILDSVLNCMASGWIGILDLIEYTKSQSRIETAFDTWLDLVAGDFFGARLARRPRETDAVFRSRIKQELRRDRCTREALFTLLQDLVGKPPQIFEPTNPLDTGCYGSLGPIRGGIGGYGCVGGWGNLGLPFQVFVRTARPEIAIGIAAVNGWGEVSGAFGGGLSAYSSAAVDTSRPSDHEIYREICRVAPAGTIVWVTIES